MRTRRRLIDATIRRRRNPHPSSLVLPVDQTTQNKPPPNVVPVPINTSVFPLCYLPKSKEKRRRVTAGAASRHHCCRPQPLPSILLPFSWLTAGGD
ncbi:unnamed protein product [Lactuca virosa]|uniref:Uncharacterized protein n=1 Tax=Lactuca virosa TaxID=75947 RepID=A0AAU9NP57_9ASTR|nr:unnamed protein product [Lactuca virosa]